MLRKYMALHEREERLNADQRNRYFGRPSNYPGDMDIVRESFYSLEKVFGPIARVSVKASSMGLLLWC